MRYYTPFVSFRSKVDNGTIADFVTIEPINALDTPGILTFLVHGYNNDQKEASDSYQRLLGFVGVLKSPVIGIYWPGDGWLGPLHYMAALKTIPEVAEKFSKLILDKARERGFLQIQFVAHSLGCRLVFETIKLLMPAINASNQRSFVLTVERVIFMAGAVPTRFLERNNNDPKNLRQELDKITKALSLFSESDIVLSAAFPLGETAGFDAALPIALGHKKWVALDKFVLLEQERNEGAGHSDYWGGESKNDSNLNFAAHKIQTFLKIGRPPVPLPLSRGLQTRGTLKGRQVGSDRKTVSSREI